ncbi:hypothetical protein E3E14_25165 [Streptomyces sp. ICN441]|uniref:hypothetical protein n=1 Tax=Streptomyces sp. ICN441 TaxID=2558286 RepID=UPI00106BE88D|nr:hypothetical protein [Streptomyces sp. ICN441]TFE42477.1 hypothetical protein E3E14_25165 [Streptomyces sp. ICN441]
MTPLRQALALLPQLSADDRTVFGIWFLRAVADVVHGRDTEGRYLELSHRGAPHLPMAGYLAGLVSTRAPEPGRIPRREYLRHEVRARGGVWSTDRARRLCLDAGFAVAAPKTSRRDLEVLHGEGLLDLRYPATARRTYTLKPERTAA